MCLFVVAVFVACGCADAADEQVNDELVQMVLGLLSDSDKDIRALALEQVRTAAPGEAATIRFAEALPKLSADAQVGLLGALADRGDLAAKPAVTQALDISTDEHLRLAAIRALGKLGDATDCPKLFALLAAESAPAKKAARQGLVQLRGGDVSAAIANRIATAEPLIQVALIEILAERRALEAIPSLLDLAVGNDPRVRAAAMTALGQLAGPEHVGAMAQAVLAATTGSERSAAEKNLMFVCHRIEDPDARAQPLLDAMQTLDPGARTDMLSTLGRIGGKPALAEVHRAIASQDPAVHAAGVQALANWPDASVAPHLLDLAKQDKHEGHRRKVRMALIRIAALPDGRTDAEKLDLLKTAMKMAANDAERNYALQRAAAIRLPETLRFVLPYLQVSPQAQQACQAIVELAHDRKLRDDNKAEFHAALEQVLATAQDPLVIDRAQRYKKGQTWVRPK
jgi:HEAT repeat protein